MLFRSLDMVSPFPLLLDNIGHIVSPKIRYITYGVGECQYNQYISTLLLSKVQLLESLSQLVTEDILYQLDKLSLFDLMISIDTIRDALIE